MSSRYPPPHTWRNGADAADTYELGSYGPPLTVGNASTPLAVGASNASMTLAALAGYTGGTGFGWYTGGAVFFSRLGALIPPNPFLIPNATGYDPFSLGRVACGAATDAQKTQLWFAEQCLQQSGSFAFPYANYSATFTDAAYAFSYNVSGKTYAYDFSASSRMRLPGESAVDYAARVQLGITCLAVEDASLCGARVAAIRAWWASFRNYAARPVADVVRDDFNDQAISVPPTWFKDFLNNELASEQTFVAVPYLPFLSNCDGFDSHVFLDKLVESHPGCTRVPAAQTREVSPYPWDGKLVAVADSCGAQGWAPEPALGDVVQPGLPLYCTYEEQVRLAATNPRWFEVGEGPLWHINAKPVSWDDFYGAGPKTWGQTDALAALTGSIGVVDVTVMPSADESINGVIAQRMPQAVNLTIEYYQKTRTSKIIVTAQVTFGNYCSYGAEGADTVPQCADGDNGYVLSFSWRAAWWLTLLNLFAFDIGIYVIIYLALGVIVVAFGLVMYCLHRSLNRLSVTPRFRCASLCRVVTPAPLVGVMLSSVPAWIAIFLVLTYWVLLASPNPGSSPSALNFEAIAGDWRDANVPNKDATVHKYMTARLGGSLLVLGTWILLNATRVMIPAHGVDRFAKGDSNLLGATDEAEAEVDEEEEEERLTALILGGKVLNAGGARGAVGADGVKYDEMGEPLKPEPTTDELRASGVWTPLRWQRGAYMMTALAVIAYVYTVAYFSMGSFFGKSPNIFVIVPLIKLAQLAIQAIARDTMRDAFLCAPLAVVLNILQYMIILGSQDFVAYCIVYFETLGVTIVMRLYLTPFLSTFNAMYPLYKFRLITAARYAQQRPTKDQRLADEQEERALREETVVETEGMAPVLESYLDYSAEVTALVLYPFFMIVIYLLDSASAIHPFHLTGLPSDWGVKPEYIIYYTIFSFVTILPQLMMDVFLMNTLELVHGWRFFDYVSYQRYRYTLRPTRWSLDKFTRDEAMAEHLQLADMLCFSSQYYFLISAHAWGALIFFLGLVMQVNQGHVLFGDWVFIVYFVGLWLVLMLLKRLFVRGAAAAGLWYRKSLEGTVEDEVATRLAIGEGDSAALARERLDLAALNSERFRLRFLERLRPWIISQLPAILTPRMLAKMGADGRAHIDYIRDVYESLVSLGENAKLEADRRGGGTAEDEEEHKLEMHQHVEWATRAPPSSQGKDIARLWLSLARRFLRYRTVVRGVVEAARRHKCDLCSQHEGLVGNLRIDLATGGRLNPLAFDQLVEAYENAQRRMGIKYVEGPAGVDAAAWKVFFREHATYFMRCERCVASAADAARTVGQRDEFGAVARVRRKAEKAHELALLGLDDADDRVYDPIAIDARSPAGRALTKWLRAARLRIGGVYPKPAARDEMARYAEAAKLARERRDKKLTQGRSRVVAAEAVKAAAALFPPYTAAPAALGLARGWLFGARASLFTSLLNTVASKLAATETRVAELSLARNVEGAVESRALGAVLVGTGRDVLAKVRAAGRELEAAVKELTRKTDLDLRAREDACVRARARARRVFVCPLTLLAPPPLPPAGSRPTRPSSCHARAPRRRFTRRRRLRTLGATSARLRHTASDCSRSPRRPRPRPSCASAPSSPRPRSARSRSRPKSSRPSASARSRRCCTARRARSARRSPRRALTSRAAAPSCARARPRRPRRSRPTT